MKGPVVRVSGPNMGQDLVQLLAGDFGGRHSSPPLVSADCRSRQLPGSQVLGSRNPPSPPFCVRSAIATHGQFVWPISQGCCVFILEIQRDSASFTVSFMIEPSCDKQHRRRLKGCTCRAAGSIHRQSQMAASLAEPSPPAQ